MTSCPVRVVLALLLAAVAASTAGCGLPEKARALVSPRPSPTVVSTPLPTPLPVPPLKMEFVRIREDRVRGSAGTALCEIDIELVGAKRSEVERARVVVLTAVDDLGANLVLENAASVAARPLKAEDPEAPVVLPVPLKLAARSATSLREVSGEIELFVPGGDPAAAASDPRYLRRYRFVLKDVPLP
ncbi:MAG: hypothetical protein IPN03_17100 [Holophagales bacterium]|nr:hypothetical protein [Holophagales bacterium]